jgi:ferric-dicitrate binding protein FerR (iron transport regulator)
MINPDVIHDYLDGSLDAQSARELADWLLADPTHRARFREEVDLAVELSAIMRQEKINFRSSVRTTPGQRSQRKSTHSNRFISRARTSPKYWPLYAGAAALITVCVSVALVQWDKSTTTTTTIAASTRGNALPLFNISGHVHVERNGKLLSQPLNNIRELFNDDVVRTDASNTAQLALDNGQTRIHLATDTALVIRSIREHEQRRGTTFDVHKGSLLIEAAPQPSETPLRLLSARSNVEIVGTVVNLDVTPTSDRIAVGHGTIAVSARSAANAQRHFISAGNFCFSDGATVKTQRIGAPPPAPISSSAVVGITLIDLLTTKPIPGYEKLTSGAVIDLAQFKGRKINFRAEVQWAPGEENGHLVFALDDHQPLAEDSEPFELLQRSTGSLKNRTPSPLTNGVHYLVATPYFDATLSKDTPRDLAIHGNPGHSATLVFTIINAP